MKRSARQYAAWCLLTTLALGVIAIGVEAQETDSSNRRDGVGFARAAAQLFLVKEAGDTNHRQDQIQIPVNEAAIKPALQEGINGNSEGTGAQVGMAMFQDDQRGLLAVVEVTNLPPGNYFVGISDKSTNQATGKPTSNAVDSGADPNRGNRNSGNRPKDGLNVARMEDTTGGGSFVRIGFLQVGQDGAGRLRQRIPNVYVDDIIGMAVVVHTTTVKPQSNEPPAGSLTGLPENQAPDSLVAVGIIRLTHPQEDMVGVDQGGVPAGGINNAPQNPATSDRRKPGQSSDAHIDR